MSDLTKYTLTQALDLLDKKEITAVELTQAYIDEIYRADGVLNAFVTKTPELALAQARESDTRRQNGTARALEGLPIAHKDVFCTKDVRTTASSAILQNFVPPYESTVSDKLKQAGTVMLGKTNLDEFAMGVSTMTSHFGISKNPWANTDGSYTLVPGGSSGGAAAAVAGGLCAACTGTDTGGSVRQPASFCGVVGLKPTYGRCSRWGIIAYASSLDQAGVLARTVGDSALMLQHMAGYDDKDETCMNIPVPDFRALLESGVKGKKIGIPAEYRLDDLNADVAKVWDKGVQILQDAGAEIVPVNLPHTRYAVPVYYILSPAEASSNLARYDGVRYSTRVAGKSLDDLYINTRSSGFGEEVQRRIFLGTFVLSAGFYDAYYGQAQKVRRLIYDDFMNVYQQVDALLVPTAPTEALSESAMQNMSAVDKYLADVFTTPASLAGMPSISVPVGLSSHNLPIGLQLIGRPFEEDKLLAVARTLEKGAAWNTEPHFVKGV